MRLSEAFGMLVWELRCRDTICVWTYSKQAKRWELCIAKDPGFKILGELAQVSLKRQTANMIGEGQHVRKAHTEHPQTSLFKQELRINTA